MGLSRKLDAAQIERAVRPEVVNVSVPVETLWDFDEVTKIKKEILGRLGCLGCTSGFDIRFRHVRDFVVNPTRGITAVHELGM